MNKLSRTTNSFAAVGSGSINSLRPGSEDTINDDQFFLLYFIIGTYFGPDLKGERQPKSVLQRKDEGLSPYTSDQLANSHMKTEELKQVYYYVLRKADQHISSKLLYLFVRGKLSALGCGHTASYPEFPDFFPLELHPQTWHDDHNAVIDSIVFINNPDFSYMKLKDFQRFRRLTGLDDFLLDKDSGQLNVSEDSDRYNTRIQVVEYNKGSSPLGSSPHSRRKRNVSESEDQNIHAPACSSMYSHDAPSVPPKDENNSAERCSSAMIFLPSHPTKQELADVIAATKNGFALTGSAAMGQVGPVVGKVDIGECEDSYLFRVSLPGVKRDERDFSCEIQSDGKVLIRGVTVATGEKRVCMYSQVFEMQSQNLCPPGHFSISFQLPGPVDPQLFTGDFGIDGIFEGIVMKKKK